MVEICFFQALIFHLVRHLWKIYDVKNVVEREYWKIVGQYCFFLLNKRFSLEGPLFVLFGGWWNIFVIVIHSVKPATCLAILWACLSCFEWFMVVLLLTISGLTLNLKLIFYSFIVWLGTAFLWGKKWLIIQKLSLEADKRK